MQLTLTKPDDWHLHLRQGQSLKDTVNASAKQMARAIIMPNLATPITTAKQAENYQKQILTALNRDFDFQPLMTLYLTDNTKQADLKAAKQSGIIYGCKLYPSGATTNADNGVTDIEKIYPLFETMAQLSMPLLIHGEVVDSTVDIFDREKIFIDKILTKICHHFPTLRIVLEHISTKEAVDFINDCDKNVAATITPHHLLSNRNDMLVGAIRPHYFCLPILKRQYPHQQALIKAATGDSGKFFLGTDSAPHRKTDKESACGCAGVFSAYAAIELYAQAFDNANALDKLEGFASHYGADFYQLPRNQSRITLLKKSWQVPLSYPMGTALVVPFLAGKTLNWQQQ